MPDEYVLAGDVGGTNLRIAAVAPAGIILHQVNALTPKTGVAADVVDGIVRAAELCISSMENPGRPAGFGLALAALVDSADGRIQSSPNLPELNALPLAETISNNLKLSVVLENDATAAAIGEHWLGSSQGARNSVFATLGTGVGGGLILNGKPYRGIDGTAGEIGHICVEPKGLLCGCGSRGCVEQYASATAVVRIARELLESDPGSSLSGNSNLTSKAIYEAAVGGDLVALDTFRIMGRYLGIAFADLVDVLNPELIVVGGGAAGAWDFFIDHVRAEIRGRAFKHPADRVQLVRAKLGDTAGILGAARVAFGHI